MRGNCFLLSGIFLILLFSVSSAYEIVDNNVIYENEFASLNVFPHTAAPQSPNQTKLTQYFIAEKKIAGTHDLFFAYKFNQPLKSGKIFQLVNGEWVDRTEYILVYSDQNTKYYYNEYPLVFTDVNPIKTWKIEYEPNENDSSKKWDLILWNADNRDDIFSGQENWKTVLDPWWDINWLYDKTITITANADVNSSLDSNKTLTLNLDTAALISAGKMQSDCDDLRILYQDTLDMNRLIEGCNQTDTNVFFRTGKVNSLWRVEPSQSDVNFSLYYGNSVALAPNIDLNQVFDDGSQMWALWRLDSNFTQEYVRGLTLTNNGTPQPDIDLYYSRSNNAYRSYLANDILRADAGGSLGTGTIEALFTIGKYSGNDIIMEIGGDRFQMNAAGNTISVYDGGASFYPVPAYAVGETHHIAVSFDGTTHKIYWDGNQMAERLDAQTMTTDAVQLGAGATSSDQNFIMVGISSHAKTSFNFIPNKPVLTLGAEGINSGAFSLTFRDENTNALIDPTTLTLSINGSDANSWSGNVVNGKLDINMSFYDSGKWEFVFGDATHPNRTFIYNINNLASYNFNLGMLNDVNGTNIDFKFYNQAGSSILADANVEVKDSTGKIAERKTTNSSGEIIFYLNPNDGGYQFNINDVNGSDYNYTATIVTIKIPKDEDTLSSITPFNVRKSGVGTQDFNNLSGDQNIFVYANAVNYYTFTVSTDQNYFDRTYSNKFRGQVALYEIQPYLVSGTTGLLTWIYTINYYNNQIVPNILIQAKRDIPGQGSSVVESLESDTSGTAVFAFISLATYSLDFYDSNGTYLFTKTPFVPSTTAYYAKIDLATVDYNRTTIYPVSVTFHPFSGAVNASDTNIVSVGVDVNSVDSQITSVIFQIKHNGVGLFSATQTTGVSSGYTNYQNINVTTLSTSASLVLSVTVVAADGRTTVMEQAYSIRLSESQGGSNDWDYQADFLVVRNDLGDMGVLIFILFACLLVVGYVAFNFTGNPAALGILVGIVLGLFTFIGWIPQPVFVLIALIGLGAFLASASNRGGY